MKFTVPPETLLASGDYLAIVRDFALSKGVSPSILLKDTNIELDDLINPPALIKNLIFNHVGVNLYHQLKSPISEAIEFGLSMTTASHGSLGVAVQCAQNLDAALNVLVHFFNTRINAQDIKIIETEHHILAYLVCKYDDPDTEEQVQHFFDLSALISIATNMQHMLDTSVLEGSICIHINKPEPQDFPHHLLSGKITALFDQKTLELRVPKSWMHSPLNISNPELAKAAAQKCADELKVLSPQDLVSKVKQRIREADNHIPKIDKIAQEFFMSEATFKRRLKEQGTTYQQLKNVERFELAKSFILAGEMSLEAISLHLGFSDASNFTKAFKTWCGLSPKQFREINN